MALERSFIVPPQEAAFVAVAVEPTRESLFFVVGRIHNSLIMKAREPGFLFIYATNFLLTRGTEYRLKLTDPYGTDVEIDPTRISTPAADVVTGDSALPSIDGGTYMQFTTSKEDFQSVGVWRVQGLYVEGGIERPGDAAYFTVGEGF